MILNTETIIEKVQENFKNWLNEKNFKLPQVFEKSIPPVIESIIIKSFTEPPDMISACIRVYTYINGHRVLIGGAYTEIKNPWADFTYNMPKEEFKGRLIESGFLDAHARPLKGFTEELCWYFGKIVEYFIEYLKEKEILFKDWQEAQPKCEQISKTPVPEALRC